MDEKSAACQLSVEDSDNPHRLYYDDDNVDDHLVDMTTATPLSISGNVTGEDSDTIRRLGDNNVDDHNVDVTTTTPLSNDDDVTDDDNKFQNPCTNDITENTTFQNPCTNDITENTTFQNPCTNDTTEDIPFQNPCTNDITENTTFQNPCINDITENTTFQNPCTNDTTEDIPFQNPCANDITENTTFQNLCINDITENTTFQNPCINDITENTTFQNPCTNDTTEDIPFQNPCTNDITENTTFQNPCTNDITENTTFQNPCTNDITENTTFQNPCTNDITENTTFQNPCTNDITENTTFQNPCTKDTTEDIPFQNPCTNDITENTTFQNPCTNDITVDIPFPNPRTKDITENTRFQNSCTNDITEDTTFQNPCTNDITEEIKFQNPWTNDITATRKQSTPNTSNSSSSSSSPVVIEQDARATSNENTDEKPEKSASTSTPEDIHAAQTLCESEIKEEVLPSTSTYSVDDWCELGPSAHEFGHNPDRHIADDFDFKFKDEIKKSPRVETEKAGVDNLDCSDNDNNVQSKPFQTKEPNISPISPIETIYSSHRGKQIIYRKTVMTGEEYNIMQRSRQYGALVTVSENPMPLEKHHTKRISHNMTNLNSPENDENIGVSNLNEDKTTKAVKIEDSPEAIKNETKDSTFGANFAKELIRTLPQESHRLHPMADDTSLNSLSMPFNAHPQTVPTPFQVETTPLSTIPTSYTPAAVSRDYQSITPPSNSLQSPSDITIPFFARDFLNRLSNKNSAPTVLQTHHHQYFKTSLEPSRLYQTWVRPTNSLGYIQCQSSPSIDNGSNNNNNNKLMFLTPQTILLQQMPSYTTSVFQQPSSSSFNPYITSTTTSCLIKENQILPEIATTSSRTRGFSSRDQPVNLVSTSSFEEVSRFEKKSHLKSMGEAQPGPEIIVDFNSGNQENSASEMACHDIPEYSIFAKRKHIRLTKKQSNLSLIGKPVKGNDNDEDNASHVIDNESCSSIETSKGGGEGGGGEGVRYLVKETAKERAIPKMSRGGNDFVDPTRIKLDQDDELGDNGVSLNEDDSSDEDWLPETRDGDKTGDSENEEDIDVDEEDEDEEEGEREPKLGTFNKQQQRKHNRKFPKDKNRKHQEQGGNTNTMTCHYCGKVFHGNYHLKRHLLSHTENRPHQCNACGKRFKQKAHLHGHEIVHLREKSKPPKENNKIINVNAVQKNASSSSPKCPGRPKKVYSEKELSCNVCSKVFKTLYRLKRHVQSHTDVRPYTCKVCGKGFKQTGHRNEHEANHEKNRRKFLCNICGVIFHCRSSFNNHLKTHRSKQCIGENGGVIAANSAVGIDAEGKCVVDGQEVQHTGYDCPYCPDKFATAQGLNRHLDSHVEVRQRLHVQPYSCQICSRAFTYKHNLAKHMLTHQAPEKFAEFHKSKLKEHLASGRPSYTCSVCSKVFMRKETLAKHFKVHSGTKPFKCEVCLKEFTQNVHLKVHMRKHTGSRPFQCKRCNVGFIDSTALAKHIEYEACISENMLFHCTICDKRHYYLGSIKQHIKKEHNEEDVDKFISRTVRQKRPRPPNASTDNTCRICSKLFSEKVNLIRHVKRKHADLLKLLDNDLKRTKSENHSYDVKRRKEATKKENYTGPRRQDRDITRADRKFTNKDDVMDFSIKNGDLEKNETKSNNQVFVNTTTTNVHCSNKGIVASNTKDNTSSTNVEMEEIIDQNNITNDLTVDIDVISDENNNINNANPPIPESVPKTLLDNIPDKYNKQLIEWGGIVSVSGEVVVDNRNPAENEERAGQDSRTPKERTEQTMNCRMADDERDERITEPNVNEFLYHVGLVEKSKAGGLESSHDPACCKGNATSCMLPPGDPASLIQKPFDKRSNNIHCSGHHLMHGKDIQAAERLGGIQNQTNALVAGDFRSNLEVFCDLALMTENRLVNTNTSLDTRIIDSSTSRDFASRSANTINEFQTAVNRHYNNYTEPVETDDTHSQSSVTEAQLKELGLLVCKDAQRVRNRDRPVEDLYKEFKPWLEHLVKPPVAQSSPMLYATKANLPTVITSSNVGATHNASKSNSKTTPTIIYNRKKTKEPNFTGGLPVSYSHSYVGTHPRSSNKASSSSSNKQPTTTKPATKSTGVYSSLNKGDLTPTPMSWTSTAPPLYGIPNAQTSSNNYVHSMRLKEQLLQYVRDNASIIHTSNKTATTTTIATTTHHLPRDKQMADSSPIAETHGGKEASAQTQTPLHFDSSTTTTEIRTSYNTNNEDLPPKRPLSSTTENNAGLLQDSKILHSLLGGLHQQKQQQQQRMGAISPRDDDNDADEDGDDDYNDDTISNKDVGEPRRPPPPTDATPFPPSSISSTGSRSRHSSSNAMDDDPSAPPPLQIVTKQRHPSTASSSSSSSATPHTVKVKGPFPCQGCGKCFNARHQLKRHEMTHTEIRPYRCAECGKAFRQKVHLSDHLKRHRGQRPFLCTICGKRFVLKNELKQHTKNYCRKAPSIVTP